MLKDEAMRFLLGAYAVDTIAGVLLGEIFRGGTLPCINACADAN